MCHKMAVLLIKKDKRGVSKLMSKQQRQHCCICRYFLTTQKYLAQFPDIEETEITRYKVLFKEDSFSKRVLSL